LEPRREVYAVADWIIGPFNGHAVLSGAAGRCAAPTWLSSRGKLFRPALAEQSIAQAIALLPKERESDGFIPPMTPSENVILPVLGRFLFAGLLQAAYRGNRVLEM
jgi:ABC-type sugar transport system ATPase subunit